MITDNRHYDAIIIGGGPAGATAAATLGIHGRRVLVLEKEVFPRYHIGESLIPFNYFPLERIGMIEKLRESAFIKKLSVQFVREDGMVSKPFYFEDHQDHPSSQTWQVERAEFDHLLLKNAAEKGAEVREGVRVTNLMEEDGRVIGVESDQGRFTAEVVIDASGRDSLAIARKGWRVPDQALKKIAIWTYFEGAKRDEGVDEGATTVAYVNGKNWFWYIPLQNNRVSVGVVGGKDYLYNSQDKARDPQAIFDREVKNNAWIQDHLAIGKQAAPVSVTSDFSYRSKYCASDGLVLIGDAFAFLDPVFSSGMYFAVYSGVLAGDAVHEALEAGDTNAHRFEAYGETFRSAIEAMRKLVYSFYEEGFHFGMLLKKYPELRGDLTDCLIGNLDTDFGPLFEAMSEFMDIPEDLPHGRTTAVKEPV